MITLYGGNKLINLQWWTFPGGERNVKITDPLEIQRFKAFTIRCYFKGSNDLIDMLLLVNALRNVDPTVKLRLHIPYFPFARQDRVMTSGEPLALQVAVSLIKSCGFHEVEVLDPHSDVLIGMFEPGVLKVIPQEDLVVIGSIEGACLVSPDAGALKKIYKVSNKNSNIPVVCATKVRDPSTGSITETTVPQYIANYDIVYIVDDICDGGRTFIELAKAIREIKPDMYIVLSVTHGIFSKGILTLHEYIDEVYAANYTNSDNMDK